MTTDALDPLGRYVLPLENPVQLDAHGFLKLDSLEDQKDWPQPSAGTVEPICVLQLVSPVSFTIIAPGGAGKSTTLEALFKIEEKAEWIDLTVFGGQAYERIMSACSAGKAIYIDAIDEAALYHPNAYRILESAIRNAREFSPRWRLACRPAAWRPSLGEALSAGTSEFSVLRLLPLTEASARDLVARDTTAVDSFFQALKSAGLARFSGAPDRLRAAARQWEKTGALPQGRIESIEYEVRELLIEQSSQSLTSPMSNDRLQRIAQRIAAFFIFGQISHASFGPDESDRGITLQDIPSDPEPDEPEQRVTPADYQRVFSSALFDTAANAGVAFRHQQYAEYLAAMYIRARKVATKQVLAALGRSSDGVIRLFALRRGVMLSDPVPCR